MKNMCTVALLLASAGFASAAAAQTGSIKLLSPADGAMLEAVKPIALSYEVVPGPKVDHIHLYVDGKETAVLREAMGTHTVSPLPSGAHELCIKAVTRAHAPTGLALCHKVTVK